MALESDGKVTERADVTKGFDGVKSGSNRPRLRRLDDIPVAEWGAPYPQIDAAEHNFTISYYTNDAGDSDRIGIVKFREPKAHLFTLSDGDYAHSRMERRMPLEGHEAWEIENSDWSSKWTHGDSKHFVLVFHDSMLEILAAGYLVKVGDKDSIDKLLNPNY